jgi:NAD(P)-dependent dehydrogenase (short-subunit alcohol dehydrogenase family)
MSLVSRLKRPGPSGFGYASTAEDVTRDLDLRSKTILVTGCSAGLGRETLQVLGRRGARMIGTARNAATAQAACSELGGALAVACDLAEPSSVRACVERVRREAAPLDAIICNAGIMALPERRQAYGYELQFFTNHIGHFLLVTGLLPHLAENGRVVVVSSGAHRRAPAVGIEFDNLAADAGYSPWRAYAQSKLANLLFASELARRLPRPGQSANALHPGVIATNLGRHLPLWSRTGLRILTPLALKNVAQGAATQCYVATHPGMHANGEYFSDCNIARPSKLARDQKLAERLWKVSEQIARAS